MYPSKSTITSLSYKYKIVDIDDTIHLAEDGKKYFEYFYAGNAIHTKEEIIENANEWSEVTFDLSNVTQKNYNIDVKIAESLEKNGQETYTDLITQKYEDIISLFDASSVIMSTNTGVSSEIRFSNLLTAQREAITKVEVELVNKADTNEKISIQKTKKELETDSWTIKINYLDLIYKTEESLKDKEFKVNVKIYYINGETGYHAIDSGFVTYQTANGDWLDIHESNKEFFKILSENDGKIYPVMHEAHSYNFDDARLSVKKDGNEVAWLTYSPNGLIRVVEEGGENVSIIPKEIEIHIKDTMGNISLTNVIPGIRSLDDLEVVSSPTNVLIKINKLYAEDTIYEDNNNIYADIYNKADNTLFREKQLITSDGVYITGIENEKEYYFKLYLEVNGQKVYLYDLDYLTTGREYPLSLLDEVGIRDVEINFTKASISEGKLSIKHNSSVKNGFKGFRYEICDINENLITEQIEYKTNSDYSGTTSTGQFIIGLENYKPNEKFELIINANRGTFFEYNTTYTIKITPVVEDNTSGNIENIGDTAEKIYSFVPVSPRMLLYAKRVQATDETYIEWSISVSDDDMLITGDGIEYEIYENGNTEPIIGKTKMTLENNYSIIKINNDVINGFDPESAYTLKIYYKYYTSNKNNTAVEKIETKRLAEIENGIFIGTVNWKIEDGNIKLKFYDSYELSEIKQIKYTILDGNRTPLTNALTITNINIIDQTADANDSHKSITFKPDYTFEEAKSYLIAVRFYNAAGEEIANFEAESPETNN